MTGVAMLAWAPGWPALPFNPITAPEPLSTSEILAGPFGLLAFVLLIPAIRLAPPRLYPHALIGAAIFWLIATAGPGGAAIVLTWSGLAAAWVAGLISLHRRARVSTPIAVALLWLGVHALYLPIWWAPQWSLYGWTPVRLPVMHALGVGYLLLRIIGWGTRALHEPQQPRHAWTTTSAWLLYPPAMRLGPVLSREDFLAQVQRGPAPIPWAAIARRGAGFLLGATLLAVLANNTPRLAGGGADVFTAPELLSTDRLLRVFYNVPLQVYLMMWTYNELAALCGMLSGVHVPQNFHWLPCATSVRDFWRRWHISYSLWLREHIYLPLGGARRHAALNLCAVFLYCGLWHGAAASYLLWAASQAAAILLEQAFARHIAPFFAARCPAALSQSALLVWRAFAWLLTMHYQIATITLFMDFEHAGLRFFPELVRRLWAG